MQRDGQWQAQIFTVLLAFFGETVLTLLHQYQAGAPYVKCGSTDYNEGYMVYSHLIQGHTGNTTIH